MIRIDTNNIRAVSIQHPLYPKEWKGIPDCPQTLYCVGNIELLTERKFTIVGSRTTPVYALKTGMEIAKALTQAFVIVTGTADGGDAAAIEGGVTGGGKVICVLAGGFSALPQNNLPLLERVVREGGLVLSPHAYDTPVRSFSYEYRNKLLALLGEGTLVLGAAEKSGALLTARQAQKRGKPVFALPYAPNTHAGVGCNALIKNGAYLTETATDISSRLGVRVSERKTEVVLTENEEKLLSALRELGEGHLTDLAEKTGIPVFKARALLSALEVKGLAVSLGGNRYAPV